MKWLLAGLLLLPPLYTHAFDNPFKPDHRVDGVIVLGVALAASGIYLMHKEPPKSEAKNFIEGVAASISLLGGIGVVLYAPELVKMFDEAKL